MECGINIKCKKRFGQFLATEKPYVIMNDTKTWKLAWNKEFFIPLQPNLPYKFTVQFPYLGNATGPASFVTQVGPNETQSYEYQTPFLMTSKGSIKRKT